MSERVRPVEPAHGRKLGLIGVALTTARSPRNDVEVLTAVRDEIENVMIESGFCVGAQFSWVTLSIRFGVKDDEAPRFQKINKKFGDLPLAIEISTEHLAGKSFEELKQIFRSAALTALIVAGEKYLRPVAALKNLKNSSGPPGTMPR